MPAQRLSPIAHRPSPKGLRITMRYTAVPAIVVLLAAVSAFAQEPIHAPKKLDRTDFQAAIADVGPAFVAGQPTADALRSMKAAGVTTVISLRRQSEMDDRQQVPFDEAALVKELGMTYVHIPLGGADSPYTPEAVSKVNDAMLSSRCDSFTS